MSNDDFPALFQAADQHSNDAQRKYLLFVRIQYVLLMFASVFAFLVNFHATWKLVYIAVLAGSAGTLVYMSSAKPEKDWYKFRALAESVKTRTWLFIVGGQPFEIGLDSKQVEIDFLADLHQILDANAHVRDRITRFPMNGNQISEKMRVIRAQSLAERSFKYSTDRIKNQKNWYTKKSEWNDNRSKNWVIFAICIHVCAIAYVLFASPAIFRVFPLPAEFLLVVASATLGWIQIKRFNELAGSYALTAHEISMVEGRLVHITSEGDFAEFVSDAELLFSREHTQWAARQPN